MFTIDIVLLPLDYGAVGRVYLRAWAAGCPRRFSEGCERGTPHYVTEGPGARSPREQTAAEVGALSRSRQLFRSIGA